MKKASIRLLIGAIALGALLSACGDTRSELERLADANAKLAQANYRSAIIDLRNVLRNNPQSMAARLALAEALVAVGDSAAAEKEIQRAIDLGAEPTAYYRTYGRALAGRNAHAEVIAEIDPAAVSDPALASELTAMRARAMLAMGSATEADRIFTEVLAAGLSVEAQRIALLGKARIANDAGDPSTAERLARQSFELAPDSSDSFLRVGQLLIAHGKFADATAHLTDEVARGVRMTRMERFRMLGDRATALVGVGELDAAAAAAESMASLAPEHPMSALMRGRIELQRGNLDLALEHLQALNAKSPNFVPGLVLLGSVNLQRGELDQAEEYLAKALTMEPRNGRARSLLAEARMRASRPEDAAAMLRQGQYGNSDDPRILALLGRAALQAGDDDAGIDYLRQSIAKDPTNFRAKLSLAGALISQGTPAARGEATALIVSLPDGAIAENRKKMLLIITQFDRDDPQSAKDRLDQLLEQAPDDVSLQMLAGNFHFSIGDLKQARARFEQAAQLAPDALDAAFSILRIDRLQDDFTRSRALFEVARQRDPRDATPPLALSRIAEAQGDHAGAVELIREAQKIDETALGPNLVLAAEAIRQNDFDTAENYARTALAGNPDAARAHGAVGIIKSRRGLYPEAVMSLRRATELAPDDFVLQYELARAQIADGQVEEARKSYMAAHELEPSHYDTLRSLVLVEVRSGNEARSGELIQKFKSQFGAGPAFDQLTGEVRFEQERWAEALAAFSAAYAAAPTWPLASYLYRVRLKMGAPDASESLRDWIERQPDQAPARLTLAQHYQNQNQNSKAIAEYEILLERNLESPIVLNNLAWLYFQHGNEQQKVRALEMAERALRQVPRNYDIADTYGWMQFQSGDRAGGVETLRAALANTTPKRSPDIAYHLAVVLNATGAENEARETLFQALSSTTRFDRREEAQQLYDSL